MKEIAAAEAESRSIHSEVRETPRWLSEGLWNCACSMIADLMALPPGRVVREGSFDGGEKLLEYFAFEHLQEPMRAVAFALFQVATHMVRTLPPSAERTAGLRKLLEAKDCFVRAALP